MVHDVTQYLYEEIAEKISHQLDSGILCPGEKLPSLRTQGRRYRCSLSVVMQAYALLEAQGRIFSVEKSGFFASSQHSMPLPAPEQDHFSLQSKEAEPVSIIGKIVEASNDSSIVPLGAGVPDQSFLPGGAIKRVIHQTMKDHRGILSGYTGELGLWELRREITQVMEMRGVEADPEEILITNGCTEALALAVQSCSSPGDVIVLESPVFLGIIQILKVLKRRILTIPTSPESGMDLNRLEEVLRNEEVKAVVMTAIYQNPLGFLMPEENRIRAVELANRYGITLIEDDIYHDCSFRHRQERPLKSFDTEGRVLYCSSFSKTLAPALRTGWLMGGSRQRQCRNLKMAQSLGNSALIQKVLAEYLSGPGYLKHLIRLQKIISRQAVEMTLLLTRYLPEGTAITQPEGSYYLWVELPERYDSLKLFEKLLKKGISIVPGEAFSPEERYRSSMRISYASPITEDTEKALQTLAFLLPDTGSL